MVRLSITRFDENQKSFVMQCGKPSSFTDAPLRDDERTNIMGVRIRLARFGTKNRPYYRLYVADSRAPRDGKHLEIVGRYDPIAQKDGHKHVSLNIERIKYWLSCGAQPSDTVARLLGQAGVIPALPRRGGSTGGGNSASRGFAASGTT